MGSLEGTFDTKLHDAVRAGDVDSIRTALQQGYDPNLIGLYQWSPLHEAAYNGEPKILRMLLEKKGWSFMIISYEKIVILHFELSHPDAVSVFNVIDLVQIVNIFIHQCKDGIIILIFFD